MQMSGITILGVGPGETEYLTQEAWNVLQDCTELIVRTRRHPFIQSLSIHLQVNSFDNLFDEGASMDGIFTEIVESVLKLGKRQQGIVYAVPGHPYVAEATVAEIVHRAQLEGLPVRVINGLSLLEPVLTALGIPPLPQLTVIDALEAARHYAPVFPPHTPVLLLQLVSSRMAARIKAMLRVLYPDDHPVCLVHAPGTEDEIIEKLILSQIDCSQKFRASTALYIPTLGSGTSFEEFLDVVAQLRSPDGCPWDREQTHQSLRATLLEETYEVLETLDDQDISGLQEELGDLLLQVYLHAQIAMESDQFTMADVLNGIYSKIIRRHPHVFARQEVDDIAGVLKSWERIKAEERAVNGKPECGVLDGVVKTLPALTQADQYLKRAARVGFDWPDIPAVLVKLQEELYEVNHASNGDEQTHEIGDLLLAVVNLARWVAVDPESALREANLRFKARFKYIESKARQGGKSVSDFSPNEMLAFWQEAKKLLEG